MRVKYFCVNNGIETGLFIIAPIVCTGVCFKSLFCCAVHSVLSSFKTIELRKRMLAVAEEVKADDFTLIVLLLHALADPDAVQGVLSTPPPPQPPYI